MHELGIVVRAGKIVSLSGRQMADIKFWLEKDHLTDLDEKLPQVAQTSAASSSLMTLIWVSCTELENL